MTVIEKDVFRTLRNWVADGVITVTQAQSLIDNEKASNMDRTLISYDQLGNWKLIDNSMRFDVVWNSGYVALI